MALGTHVTGADHQYAPPFDCALGSLARNRLEGLDGGSILDGFRHALGDRVLRQRLDASGHP
ncbi:hypothetical protein D3C78_1707300 [compost metagenome]